MSERTSLNEIEKKLVKALGQVTFLPASYDKRFYRSLSVDGLYTEKQKRYLHFIFNKYRRQIAYAAWRAAADAFRMYPDNKHTFSDYWETVK